MPRFRVRQADVRLSWARPARAARLAGIGDVPPHDHEFHEIGLAVRGAGRHLARDGVHPLRPGALYVIPPGEAHALEADGSMTVLNAYYLAARLAEELSALLSEQGLAPLLLEPAGARRRQVILPRWHPLASALLTLARDGAGPSPLLARAALMRAAALVAQGWAEVDPSIRRPLPHPAAAAEIERIDRRARAGRAFDPAPTADAPSADRLTRLFREATGQSRRAYHGDRRHAEACARLAATHGPIGRIGMDLGYADAAHFARDHRRRTGLSPRAWRAAFGPNASDHDPPLGGSA